MHYSIKSFNAVFYVVISLLRGNFIAVFYKVISVLYSMRWFHCYILLSHFTAVLHYNFFLV